MDIREKMVEILDVYEIESVDPDEDINKIIELVINEAIECVRKLLPPDCPDPTQSSDYDGGVFDSINALEGMKHVRPKKDI